MNHNEQVNHILNNLPSIEAHYRNLQGMRREAAINNNKDGMHQVGQKILKIEQMVGPFVLDAWQNESDV